MQKKKTDLILSIDAGTQSVRAVLFNLKGNIVDIVKTKIKAFFSNKPGWAEQNPEYFWEKLSETSQKLLSKNLEYKERIVAVTLTTQRGTVINLDKFGKPLRPAIIWLDQRQAKKTNKLSRLDMLILRIVNMKESVIHAVKNAECNWIMQNQKEIWKKTDKYLFLSGYLTYKLTGKFKDSIGNIVGYMPFDYKKKEWTSKTHRNYKMFPVEQSMLPELVKPSEILAHISTEASKETGIPVGLPLFAAASDKASEVLGSGVIEDNVACLSYGTTATVQTTMKKYKEIIRFFPPYPSAVPNYFNTEIMIYRGFWMVDWFKKQCGHLETIQAKEQGKNPEELFDKLIDEVPPGSMGLTLQPYWSPGVKIPGTEAKGAIIGFGDVHTRAHIYRSIIEGLAYSLKDGLQRTERRTKVKIKKLLISGGGSQNKNVLQLTSDIFNIPVEKPHTHETSALGAAISAAVGMKYYPDYKTAVKFMCRVSETYTPNQEVSKIYNNLYNKIYKRMYKKLQPLYHEIRNITGYPEKI